MVVEGVKVCPYCRGELKHYDYVQRLVRTKGGKGEYVRIRRLKCSKCNKLHREIPNDIYPYKQYEAEIINGVLAGYIDSDTIGYEDRPCEMTMRRWLTRKTHSPL